MAIHEKTLDEKCKSCGQSIVMVHMKNPYLDDFLSGCINYDCGEYEDLWGHLIKYAKTITRSEE